MVLQYGAISLFVIISRFMLFFYCRNCFVKGNTFAKEKYISKILWKLELFLKSLCRDTNFVIIYLVQLLCEKWKCCFAFDGKLFTFFNVKFLLCYYICNNCRFTLEMQSHFFFFWTFFVDFHMLLSNMLYRHVPVM